MIGESNYTQSKVNEWCELLAKNVCNELQTLSPNFKYMITAMIIRKCGAGMHLDSACSWDVKSDAGMVVQYENTSLQCITTVFAVLIQFI